MKELFEETVIRLLGVKKYNIDCREDLGTEYMRQRMNYTGDSKEPLGNLNCTGFYPKSRRGCLDEIISQKGKVYYLRGLTSMILETTVTTGRVSMETGGEGGTQLSSGRERAS